MVACGRDRSPGTPPRSSLRGGSPFVREKDLQANRKTRTAATSRPLSTYLIGGLYLPNGNPYPGPKFDYKLRWFKRLHDYAAELLELEVPVVLAGDYNVMPTEIDVYKPERWTDDALFRVEVREAYKELIEQGWTDALRHLHPDERIYTFWDYFRNAYARDAGLRTAHHAAALTRWLDTVEMNARRR